MKIKIGVGVLAALAIGGIIAGVVVVLGAIAIGAFLMHRKQSSTNVKPKVPPPEA